MKLIGLFSFSVCLLLGSFSSFAQTPTVFLVDNTPGAPSGTHVFSTLDDALTAATAGDIIHVQPSTTSYGTVTINVADISIFGIGFNPDKDLPILSTFASITVEADNVRLSGLRITNEINVALTNDTNGLTVDGCLIFSADIGDTNSGATNVIFRNNIFGQMGPTGASLTGAIAFDVSTISSLVTVTNNIFSGTASGFGSIDCDDGCNISNNLFIGDGSANVHAFETITNSSVSNNIFYGRRPDARTSISNVNYENNFSVGASSNAIPTGSGNTEAGTVTSITDPASVFQDPNVVLQLFWDFSWDPTLSTSALDLIGGGSDGTDIGITGSTAGFSTTGSGLPVIQVFNAPDLIRQGDDLQADVQAEGN